MAGLPRKNLTIKDVINLIVEEISGAQLNPTVDTVKSGDPSQPVRAVLTTFLATQSIVDYAVQHNVNLIITHEPVFYNHLDETQWLEDNPVYQKKREALEDNGIVVWRCHDYWHAYKPSGIVTGALKLLGWEAYAGYGSPPVVPDSSRIPGTTLPVHEGPLWCKATACDRRGRHVMQQGRDAARCYKWTAAN